MRSLVFKEGAIYSSDRIHIHPTFSPQISIRRQTPNEFPSLLSPNLFSTSTCVWHSNDEYIVHAFRSALTFLQLVGLTRRRVNTTKYKQYKNTATKNINSPAPLFCCQSTTLLLLAHNTDNRVNRRGRLLVIGPFVFTASNSSATSF